jgi:1-deoxy-D-xylulose-5-phosphate synthase
MPAPFDNAYLGCLPNMVIMAASDEAELVHMVATQVAINDRPSSLPLSRGAKAAASRCPEVGIPLEIGKGRIVRQGSQDCATAPFGTRLASARRRR